MIKLTPHMKPPTHKKESLQQRTVMGRSVRKLRVERVLGFWGGVEGGFLLSRETAPLILIDREITNICLAA